MKYECTGCDELCESERQPNIEPNGCLLQLNYTANWKETSDKSNS